MSRWLIPLALSAALVLTLGAPARAQVPQTVSYQGVLTDGAGVPLADGNYSLTFRLYEAASGGVALWNETQVSVPLARGGFAVLLGAVNALNLAFDRPYWLGVAVGADAELTPRIALAAAPYSLSLRLPFAGFASSAGAAMRISNSGAGPDLVVDRRLQLGVVTPAVSLSMFTGFGGLVDVLNESGIGVAGMEADVNGEGGYLFVTGNAAGSSYFYVDGNGQGSGQPRIDLVGAVSTMAFNTAASGDASVRLPAGAIDAAEVLDEPGIAQGHGAGAVVVPGPGPAMSNLVGVNLTTPASGYVVVRAHATHLLAGDGANVNYSTLQISETSGGPPETGELTYSGYLLNAPPATVYLPVSVERTYFKPAGTYTFYFQALTTATGTFTSSVYNPMINATYYPTSYGSVIVAAASGAPAPPATAAGASPGAAVTDLRALESEASRQRAALDEAERRLADARLAKQRAGRP